MILPCDLTGGRFGRLVVLCRGPNRSGNVAWVCRCDCGTEHTVQSGALRSGGTVSCGCWRVEVLVRGNTVHGAARRELEMPEYRSWRGARARCFNPANVKWIYYGGRGIGMCREWQDDFWAFFRDMGIRPKGTSLDRIDPDGDYVLGNCRWATPREQRANRRDGHVS